MSPSISPTASLTPTRTPSFSATPTSQASPTQTHWLTPPADGWSPPSGDGKTAPKIRKVWPVPNPCPKGRALIALQLEGDAGSFELFAYTKAMVCIWHQRFDIPSGPGWAYLPIDATAWPNGLVYVVATAHGNGVTSRGIGKVIVME